MQLVWLDRTRRAHHRKFVEQTNAHTQIERLIELPNWASAIDILNKARQRERGAHTHTNNLDVNLAHLNVKIIKARGERDLTKKKVPPALKLRPI